MTGWVAAQDPSPLPKDDRVGLPQDPSALPQDDRVGLSQDPSATPQDDGVELLQDPSASPQDDRDGGRRRVVRFSLIPPVFAASDLSLSANFKFPRFPAFS